MSIETVRDVRSGFANENLQEVIDAAVSAGHALQGGQQQYQTPSWLARANTALLYEWGSPQTTIDPQCAGGSLLAAMPHGDLYGIDLDKRHTNNSLGNYRFLHRLTCSCVKAVEVMQDMLPEAKFSCWLANPPFGIRWKTGEGQSTDSTLWTWEAGLKMTVRNGAGYLISNKATLERLGIATHRHVYLYQTYPAGVWDNTKVEIGIVHWRKTHTGGPVHTEHWDHIPTEDEIYIRLGKVRPSDASRYFDGAGYFNHRWKEIEAVVLEESRDRPDYNVYLNKAGDLRTYLSTRAKCKLKPEDIQRLARIDGKHPLTLTPDRETRKLLAWFISSGIYTIEPEAKAAIEDALSQVAAFATPLRPPTDFELVAYADEEDHLVAKGKGMYVEQPDTIHGGMRKEWVALTPGKKYEIGTGTYKFVEKFTRKKLHVEEDEDTGKEITYVREHDCSLSGTDRYIQFTDDGGMRWRFLDRPQTGGDLPEPLLWEMFQRPKVNTIAELNPGGMERGKSVLGIQELLGDFTYFDGQREYIARMGIKDYGLVGADVGTGKSLMALTLIALKGPRRTLLIAPQGTMRSTGDEDEGGEEYHASQWVSEIQRFAPTEPVFQLFSPGDYYRILAANKGELPDGIYISYPQAMFYNGAREWLPASWYKPTDEYNVEQRTRELLGLPFDPDCPPVAEEFVSAGVGDCNKDGIKCIIEPSLATLIGEVWDMVILDEAHLICNLAANVTQSFIRLQPKYRYALTATPIPNIVSNLFSIMGWLCVKDWYKGKRLNAAWPYAIEDEGTFSNTFLAQERDHTAEREAQRRGKKIIAQRASPIISAPARLLKLLKPTMAYISKEECNPNLVPCEVIDVRVPLGLEQGALYAHYMDRANIPYKNPLTKALVQMTWLRGICADPATCDYNKEPAPVCRSNFNPKTIMILQLIHQCLAKGEQVVVVAARKGQSTAIAARLMQAGIPISRIDSTIEAEQHAAQAAAFKDGRTRVLLMGIKCAQGHSFDKCPNLIIGSLEWSYGSLHQAKGRVWRLTSGKPVKVWCVLHAGTIEELLFDRVALKQDAATICLRGMRVPRDFKTVDPAEILAEHFEDFDASKADVEPESACEDQWPALRSKLAIV